MPKFMREYEPIFGTENFLAIHPKCEWQGQHTPVELLLETVKEEFGPEGSRCFHTAFLEGQQGASRSSCRPKIAQKRRALTSSRTFEVDFTVIELDNTPRKGKRGEEPVPKAP
ncbi:hypothetical protein PoB_000470800 [Plakobranchus ocellatus]|uniref:Uncharacterized protein n=1 Tax=Plakobranchus ocellatus TaxID=259542 RepID=A0AAV3Y7N5_9GAST|nr:hypothetical protein PoB_000470800 [Plakobranchus ocellatus]